MGWSIECNRVTSPLNLCGKSCENYKSRCDCVCVFASIYEMKIISFDGRMERSGAHTIWSSARFCFCDEISSLYLCYNAHHLLRLHSFIIYVICSALNFTLDLNENVSILFRRTSSTHTHTHNGMLQTWPNDRIHIFAYSSRWVSARSEWLSSLRESFERILCDAIAVKINKWMDYTRTVCGTTFMFNVYRLDFIRMIWRVRTRLCRYNIRFVCFFFFFLRTN